MTILRRASRLLANDEAALPDNNLCLGQGNARTNFGISNLVSNSGHIDTLQESRCFVQFGDKSERRATVSVLVSAPAPRLHFHEHAVTRAQRDEYLRLHDMARYQP